MDKLTLKINQFHNLIEKKLNNIKLDSSPKTMREPIEYILNGNGKRIRPILTLLATKAVGGDIKKSVNAAIAIEVLHNFTLVHDDIMDKAPTRRGKKTIHTKWDENVAILAGDAMIGIAYNLISSIKSKNINQCFKIFSNGLYEICEGQALDKEFENKNISMQSYLKMIDKKTAKLFSVSIEIGAILGGGNKREINALKKFGLYLGRSFQIQDDLLDVFANEKEFGKIIGGDIKEGKRTYLLLKALEKSKGNDRKIILNAMKQNCKTKNEINLVIEVYKKLNITDECKKIITRNIFLAKKELKKMKQNEAVKILEFTASKLENRVY